jgi:prevent-host-death family protein
MQTKLIASTEAQNNFGRVLDDVVQNNTRYIIQRRGTSQAVLMSMADLEQLLAGEANMRERLGHIIREQSPRYVIGEALDEEREERQ